MREPESSESAVRIHDTRLRVPCTYDVGASILALMCCPTQKQFAKRQWGRSHHVSVIFPTVVWQTPFAHHSVLHTDRSAIFVADRSVCITLRFSDMASHRIIKSTMTTAVLMKMRRSAGMGGQWGLFRASTLAILAGRPSLQARRRDPPRNRPHPLDLRSMRR